MYPLFSPLVSASTFSSASYYHFPFFSHTFVPEFIAFDMTSLRVCSFIQYPGNIPCRISSSSTTSGCPAPSSSALDSVGKKLYVVASLLLLVIRAQGRLWTTNKISIMKSERDWNRLSPSFFVYFFIFSFVCLLLYFLLRLSTSLFSYSLSSSFSHSLFGFRIEFLCVGGHTHTIVRKI